MDINDLTIGQAKQLVEMLSNGNKQFLNAMVGKKCIIRTYSAGVWFGEVSEKSGSEIILKNARRMWRWWAAESISLSAVAKFGINQDKSKIATAVDSVWLDAIEIIPVSKISEQSIESAEDAQAE